MTRSRRETPASDLLKYIDASPTPFHAVREATRRLDEAGWRPLDERETWKLQPGDRIYVTRGGSSLAAFQIGRAPLSHAGFRLVGAHTDSPNLRVKPNPERTRCGARQLGVEVYGAPLLSTWMDRDLSLAGRVAVRRSDGETEMHLVDFARPLMRIPSLAIHLNRNVNTEGPILDPQQHLLPVLGLDTEEPLDLRAHLAHELGIATDAGGPAIVAWDLCAYDVQPSSQGGLDGELLHAPRLDNLASCHAALCSLIETGGTPGDPTSGIVLYDHEECGSQSAKGAASPFLREVLQRILAGLDEDMPDAWSRAAAHSFFVSADMAHAVHPNYADRHDPEHQSTLGGGPVIKINANQAYATDVEGWSRFEGLCRAADVASQRFVNRSDLRCGSTIGPIAAADLGITTVDVGNPMLAMHSCREAAAASDVPRMIAALRAHFER